MCGKPMAWDFRLLHDSDRVFRILLDNVQSRLSYPGCARRKTNVSRHHGNRFGKARRNGDGRLLYGAKRDRLATRNFLGFGLTPPITISGEPIARSTKMPRSHGKDNRLRRGRWSKSERWAGYII